MGVSHIAFENLLIIKKRRFTKNPIANRKITRFEKQLLLHGIIEALRLIQRCTSKPERNNKIQGTRRDSEGRGLDKHMAPAHLIALRGLREINSYIKVETVSGGLF